jgi:hypothetical protein
LANYIKILIFAWLFQLNNTAKSQQFNFDNYNRANGLVSNEADCIAQSREGYMLFGTPSGLSIFDGSSFYNYDAAKGFTGNIISAISELPGGELVLFTNSNHYYRFRDKKLLADSFATDDGFKKSYRTKQGDWIVTGYKGIYQWTKGHLNKLNIRTGGTFPGINCVLQWQDSLLVVGRSYEPLEIYNMHGWRLAAASAEKIFVRNFFTDNAGNIWIATIGNGMMMMEPSAMQNGKIQFAKLPALFGAFSKTEFRAIVQDREQNLWIAGINNGLIKYNAAAKEFTHFSMEQGLISNTIFSLCCDREDNLWIGSNRGVQKLVYTNVFSYSSAQGLPADLVLDALPVKNNSVITCGYSGLALIKNNAGKAISWKPPLEDEYIFSLLEQGNKYYGLSLRKLVELSIINSGIAARKIIDLPEHSRCMIPFQKDKLLLGGDSSIFLFAGGKLVTLTKEIAGAVSCMATDNSGNLWTGGLNNSIKYYSLNITGNKSEAISIKLLNTYKPSGSGPQDYIKCMVKGKKGGVLYGTARNGLFIIEILNGKIFQKKAINVTQGLSNNSINALSWSNDSSLLVSTGAGLDKIIFRAGGDSFVIRNINGYYNIINSVYNLKEDSAGKFLLATEAGFYSIPDVNTEQGSPGQLPVVISAIRLLSFPDSIINIKAPVELGYNNSDLSVSFSSPSFRNEKNTRYTYMLRGDHDSKWSPPAAAIPVTYSNLPPGHYTFLVKPVSLYGDSGSPAASFEFIVVPAIWQRTSFYVFIFVLLAIIVFFIIRRRIRVIRRESMFKTKIAETEMMALRAQMNPHFIFNCMNIIDGLITSNRNTEAQDFLQKFSRVIRLVLENSQHQLVTLQQDLQALKLYTELEAIRFNHHFDYVFEVDEDLTEGNYTIPPLLLQPYVENAIVHGLRNREAPGGKLSVSIKKIPAGILAVVEDNGIGRKRSAALKQDNEKPHQQIGMRVTGKRIELLKQVNPGRLEINIENANPLNESGTRVSIVLPQDIKFE